MLNPRLRFHQGGEGADGRYSYLLCDVMGHGVQAALVPSLLNGLIDRLAERAADPARLLTELNSHFIEGLRHRSEPVFATTLCVACDPSSQYLPVRQCRAPHPLALQGGHG